MFNLKVLFVCYNILAHNTKYTIKQLDTVHRKNDVTRVVLNKNHCRLIFQESKKNTQKRLLLLNIKNNE